MSFGRNPFFDDDPFERMERMFASMDPLFGNSFFAPPRPPQHLFGVQQPRGYRQEPVIEEVDDYVDQRGASGRGSADPIIEEPEEDGAYVNANPSRAPETDHYTAQSYQHHPHHHPRRQQHNGASHGVQINIGRDGIPEVSQFGNGVRTMFSYTSSQTMSQNNGSQPVVYSSSSTTRIGPGGVRETTSTTRDGVTGQESVTVSRAIRGRGRTITRTRDAMGHEQSRDILNNLSENETANFDQEWAQYAHRSLPSSGYGNPRAGARGYQGGQHPRIEY